MSLAAGLGGFWSGFDKGNMLGIRLQNNYRAKKNQNEIDEINQQAKTDFNNKVQSGEYDGDQFYDYMMKNVAPKIRDTYISQGNYDTANNFNNWMDSDAGKRKTKLFGQGYAGLMNGDHDAVIDAAKQLASLNGIKEPNGTYIPAKDGNPAFYRFSFVDGNGTRQFQTIPEADAANVLARSNNPQAAYEAEVASANAQHKRQEDLGVYASKKLIDAQLTQPQPALTYNDAFKIVQEDPQFSDASFEEKNKRTREIQQAAGFKTNGFSGFGLGDQTAISGAPAQQPQGKVIVDTATGKPVAGYSNKGEEAKEQERADNLSPEKKDIISRAYDIWQSGEYNGQQVPPDYLAGQLAARGINPNDLPKDMRRSLPKLGFIDRAGNGGKRKGLTNMLDQDNGTLMDKWQSREPQNEDETGVKNIEANALEMMKNGEEPYKIQLQLRNIPTSQKDNVSPEFRIMYNRYEEAFDYDKARQQQGRATGISSNGRPVNNVIGLGRIPVPTQRPLR